MWTSLRLTRDRVHDLLSAFSPDEFYVPPPEVVEIGIAREQKGHFNLSHVPSGFKADMYPCGRDPVDSWALEHAIRETIGNESFALAPPEYVILGKLEFFSFRRIGQTRPRHSVDTIEHAHA